MTANNWKLLTKTSGSQKVLIVEVIPYPHVVFYRITTESSCHHRHRVHENKMSQQIKEVYASSKHNLLTTSFRKLLGNTTGTSGRFRGHRVVHRAKSSRVSQLMKNRLIAGTNMDPLKKRLNWFEAYYYLRKHYKFACSAYGSRLIFCFTSIMNCFTWG